MSGIIRRLESSGETEISSEDIGLQVLEALKSLDDVAFVRYASVYRDFTHIEDFSQAISRDLAPRSPATRALTAEDNGWQAGRRALHGGRHPAVALASGRDRLPIRL